MSRIKTISTEVKDINAWFEYKHDKTLLPNGKEGDYYYGEASGAVMVIPVLPDGRLILVRQYRYLRDKYSLEFPCGGKNPDESPNHAVERELLEETGWRAKDYLKIGTIEPSRTFFRDEIHFFVAGDLEQAGPTAHEEGEIIEVIYRRVDEFEDLIRRGEIWDGQTLAAWAIGREFVLNIIK